MKNYLIVGASSGIGLATAKILSAQGHHIHGTYNNTDVSGVNGIKFQHCDVKQEELKLELPEVLDGVVYCPGAIDLKPFTRIKPAAFIEDLELQVVGAVRIIQHALPVLKKSTNPSIVLFSTVAVQSGFNFHSKVSVSKGAIEGLSKALAAEFAPLIRVNTIAPSLTDTPLAAKLLSTDEKKEANAKRHPLKKIGTPEDIAEMAAFLLSDKSGWITGQTIHIDGGMSTLRV
jgi:NAD(P)-dependent dehydrogenase (short-subunit alcohol dehydrogenase family)